MNKTEQHHTAAAVKHISEKIERVKARIAEMNEVRQHSLDCDNVNDAIQVQLMIAPLTVKLESLKQQLYRVQHPQTGYKGTEISISNYNYINHDNN